MKICAEHYRNMNQLIRNKGMGHMITENANDAQYKASRWLNGEIRMAEFDPLVISTLEICQKATQIMGHYLINKSPNGHEYCPLCEIGSAFGNNADKEWIDNCTDAILAVATLNGLTRRH